MKIRKALKEFVDREGSYRIAAKELNVTYSALWLYVHRKRDPRYGTMIRIAARLGRSIEEVWG